MHRREGTVALSRKEKELVTNKYGVIQYPKGDARRLFVLLAIIDKLERPTITSIAEYSGHNKGTIDKDVNKLRQQFGVLISKNASVYRIEDWGIILKKSSIRLFFKNRKQA